MLRGKVCENPGLSLFTACDLHFGYTREFATTAKLLIHHSRTSKKAEESGHGMITPLRETHGVREENNYGFRGHDNRH